MSIDQFGGAYGVRDLGLLESAIGAAGMTVAGEFAHSVPFGIAAAYAFHICKNHPFIDGNKRAALGAMVVFLHVNGWTLCADELAVANQVLAIAEGTLDKESMANWIESTARARPTIELRTFFALVTEERLIDQLGAFQRSGNESQIQTSVDEAKRAMPALHWIERQTSPIEIPDGLSSDEVGRIQQQAMFQGMSILLGSLHRIAEDTGYEW